MSMFELQTSIAELIETLLPDDDFKQAQANAAAIAKDGTVIAGALRAGLPWSRADVTIPGAATAGSNVRRVAFPQGAVIRHVSITAGTTPTTTYGVRLRAGSVSENVSLQAGVASTMTGITLNIDPSSWLLIDVTNGGGAADIEITLHYSVGG